LTVKQDSTRTVVTSTRLSKTFSTANQAVTLSASVNPGNSAAGGRVNEGTVTFTILNASNHTVATLSGAAVSSGIASITYDLAGLAAGSYHIHATYIPAATSPNFTASASTANGTLKVAKDSTTTAVSADASVTFSSAQQSVTLSATVSPGNSAANGEVNEGTVTFTVVDIHNHRVGSPVTSGTVSHSSASVSFMLPGGTAIGTYFIHATYKPKATAPNFTASSDVSSVHTLIVHG
jgi:hypothetical protein